MLITIASCVISELIFELIVKKKITVGDMSAVVTGLPGTQSAGIGSALDRNCGWCFCHNGS